MPSQIPSVSPVHATSASLRSAGLGTWRATGATLLALASLGLGACKGPGFADGVGIELDRKLNDTQKANLTGIATRVAESDVNVPAARSGVSLYTAAFGTPNISGVITYLDTRISVLMAPGDLEARITSEEAADENGLTTLATNVGSFLWLMGVSDPTKPAPAVKFNGRKVRATSMRSGIVQLDYGFFERRIFPIGSELAQLGVLVHEARHSDCTGGLSRSTIDALVNGQDPEEHSCGHLHGTCPEGHPLAGIVACDVHAWGAYAMGAIYAANLTQHCRNCGGQERAALLMDANESVSRVVPIEAMVRGEAGLPDLSSSDVIRP